MPIQSRIAGLRQASYRENKVGRKAHIGIIRGRHIKGECIRPGTPLSLEDARRLVKGYVEHYNNVRLNSAIGYITPKGMLAGISTRFRPSGIGN